MLKNCYFYIIGAGFAGQTIASDIKKERLGSVLAFLDDDEQKIGQTLFDAPILGPINQALSVLDKQATVLIAMPSLNHHKLYTIFMMIKNSGFKDIRILPRVSQLLSPHGAFLMTREVDAADFLEREPILLNLEKTLDYIKGKRVLITGAGGSIGSELARQLLMGGASRLYLFGHGENSIYQAEKDLRKFQEAGIGRETVLVPVIGEMQDSHYMEFLLQRLNADIIFHCAAHKHVPLMEKNPVEAIKNNVFGILNVVEAAKKTHIQRLILISTDKAVEPNNTYGASKALGEHIILKANSEGYPFFVVRFGNVLGSRGSIIPLFKEQLAGGGPLTVTHKDMRRYFMTIPEAVSLVLLSGNAGNAHALFLLDMGESISIFELAKKVALVHGFDADKGEIEIKFIGLREGETLEESLCGSDENCIPTSYPRLLAITKNKAVDNRQLEELLEALRPVCYHTAERPQLFRNKRFMHELLKKVFPSLSYDPDEPVY
jgi:FlaA1/EpsC-like NDP-sugar epimerase